MGDGDRPDRFSHSHAVRKQYTPALTSVIASVLESAWLCSTIAATLPFSSLTILPSPSGLSTFAVRTVIGTSERI